MYITQDQQSNLNYLKAARHSPDILTNPTPIWGIRFIFNYANFVIICINLVSSAPIQNMEKSKSNTWNKKKNGKHGQNNCERRGDGWQYRIWYLAVLAGLTFFIKVGLLNWPPHFIFARTKSLYVPWQQTFSILPCKYYRARISKHYKIYLVSSTLWPFFYFFVSCWWWMMFLWCRSFWLCCEAPLVWYSISQPTQQAAD